jgi:hypothetical protein
LNGPGRSRLIAAACGAALSLLAALAPAGAGAQGIAGLEVVGTSFKIRLTDGTILPQEKLIGARLAFTDGAGRQVRFRIESIAQDPQDPEISLYRIVAAEPETGRWVEFCGPDPDGQRLAFPLAGTWDETGRQGPASPGAFTMACTGGAIGKCVRFGYKPWKAAPDGGPMEPYHQACVRMVRADYCGDGKAHTRDGTAIDPFDRQGIQTPDRLPDMRFEAAWGPGGATCIARPRLPDLATLEEVLRACPRLARRSGDACDEASARRDPAALLFNLSR